MYLNSRKRKHKFICTCQGMSYLKKNGVQNEKKGVEEHFDEYHLQVQACIF